MPVPSGQTLRRLASLSRQQWRYLALATKELALARIRHATKPTGTIIRALQETGDRTRAIEPGCAEDLACRAWAIAAVAARVPWRADCLLQTMAADRWLRRDRLATEFYLGVATSSDKTFGAHAWLRSGGQTITGGDGEGFAPIVAPETRAPGPAPTPPG